MDYSDSRSLRATLRENSQCGSQAEHAAPSRANRTTAPTTEAEHAQALVREAQAALDDYDRKEAAAVGQSWPPRTPSPKEREARRTLEEL